MSDSFVQLPPDSTGKLLDTSQLTVGANTVQRERMNIADPTTAAALAGVVNAVPAATDYGIETRPVFPLQGSTTSGQGGPLTQAAVTTAAPAYTTAQTSPLSLTTAGSLRVAAPNLEQAQASTTSGQVGPLVLAAVTTGQPTYTTAQSDPLSMDTHGSLRTAALSGAVASALADNQVNQSFFTSNTAVAQVLSTGNWGYGGAFSGAASAGLQGWSKTRQATVFKQIKAQAVTSGTPVSIWTPGTGNKFRFLGFHVSLSVAGSVMFEDATGTEFMRTPLMAAGIGQASANFGGFGYLSTAANNQLFIDVTATGSVSGYVFGTEE